jgi:hypothetical protein
VKKSSIIVYDQPVSQVVQKYSKLVFDYPDDKIWNQKGVSLKRRLKQASGLKDRIRKALLPASLSKYVVPVDASAPTRCIDGRIRTGWDNDPDLQKCPLGPKVAGGTVHAALTQRIVDAENLRENLRFEEDIKAVIKRFKDIGIGFGGHIDDNQHGLNTGCGAVDNINLILDRLQQPTHQEQLRGLAHLILAEAYDARYIVREASAQSQESVPSLHGPHNEVGLILNFIPGTTVDTDRFSHDNDDEIQLFAWDIWHMYEEAQRLYDYDMHQSVEAQRTAIDKRMKYVTTRTLLGISTLMVLTDGSLRLIAATPGPKY